MSWHVLSWHIFRNQIHMTATGAPVTRYRTQLWPSWCQRGHSTMARNAGNLFEGQLSIHGDVMTLKFCLHYWPFVKGIHRSLAPVYGLSIVNMLYYNDVIMSLMASQITILAIVYSTVYSDADQGKYPSSASLVFVWGIHRGPVNSPHKWPVTRKMFPFDDVVMEGNWACYNGTAHCQQYDNLSIDYVIFDKILEIFSPPSFS